MKDKIFKLTFLALILALTFNVLMPFGVLAEPGQPVLTAINETHAWRNVLETGDYLLVARYNVVNGTSTTTDISDTFVFRLMDATNTNELGVVEAYPYQNDGWGQGVVSWYFPAASAPAWAGSYWVRIEGKITVYTTTYTVYNYNLPSTTYSTYTVESDIQNDIASKLTSIAKKIGSSWTPVVALTEESESGTVLSQYGEAYFRPVIPGIQAMCPKLFLLQVNDVTSTNTTWSTNKSTELGNLVSNSTSGTGITSVADLFDMSFEATAAIPIVMICVALIIVGAVQGNILSGIINSSVVLSGAASAGWFPLGALMIISFICGVYILFHLIWKGSG